MPIMADGQRLGLKDVSGHDLDLIQPGPALQALRIAHQTADAIARLQQARHQAPTDVAGGPGDEHRHGFGCFSHWNLPGTDTQAKGEVRASAI